MGYVQIPLFLFWSSIYVLNVFIYYISANFVLGWCNKRRRVLFGTILDCLEEVEVRMVSKLIVIMDPFPGLMAN